MLTLSRRSAFKTFPAVLVINCRRFSIVNWVPTKLDIPIVVEDSGFALDPYLSTGLQPGEEELPDDSAAESAPAFTPNAGAMAQLTAMGFPEPRCEKALYNTGNSDPEAAMNWLFVHMEDADIDEPFVIPSSGAAGGGKAAGPDPEKIEQVQAMGFTAAQAKKALKQTGGNVEAAVGWIFEHMDESFADEDDGDVPMADAGGAGEQKEDPGSKDLPANFKLDSIVCHKGGSIHAGHYVAFVKKDLREKDQGGEEEWVLFNDEKVVQSGGDADEMKKFA